MEGKKMTSLKRMLYLSLTIIITSALLAGCIPSEYIKGVMLHTDYPIDDFPIMENAIVFYCDKDEDNVTIRYGTDEDISTVADFYKTLFDEKQITLSDERQTDSRYSSEGLFDTLSFSIKATKASGEYEEKMYTTVVRVKIEFLGQIYNTQEKLIGFWRYKRESSQSIGGAIHFIDENTVISYRDAYSTGIATWEVIDEKTIALTFRTGQKEVVNVSVENIQGKECIVWSTPLNTSTYYRDASRETSDSQLSNALGDNTWYFVHYLYDDGEIRQYSLGNFEFNSDGTFKDEDGDSGAGTWLVSNGWLYCSYDDGRSITRPISIEDFGSVMKFILFNKSEYWLYINVEPRPSELPEFAKTKWYIYSNHPDNELITTYEGTIEFGSDYLISYYRTGNSTATDGSWFYDGDIIFAFHEDGTFIWDPEIRTDEDGRRNLYLLAPFGYEDLSGFTITDTSMVQYISDNKTMTSVLTAGAWNSENYVNSSGIISSVPETTIEFQPDGTFTQKQQDETLSGTWSFKGETLRMKYSSTGKTHKYPDSYIKMASSEGATILILGDGDKSYFKYTLDD